MQSDHPHSGARLAFETLGNASIQVYLEDQPLLVTDPWLRGHAYFGSWGLDHPPSEGQIGKARESRFVWISHGHPDHLHPASMALLDPARQHVLIPAHYTADVRECLEARGFQVTVMEFKRWLSLAPGVRILCMQHRNQDAILLIELGDALVVNRNDCPLHGEKPFVRRVVAAHRRSYLTSLCAVESDMVNRVDAEGRRTLPMPDELKPGAIWEAADLCRQLGIATFCCSSSQHLYCRSDSAWANAYRITFGDMRRWWNAPDIQLVGPYARIDLTDGSVTPMHPSYESDWSQVSAATGADDWQERMSAEDWKDLERFIDRFELLVGQLDFLAFTVAGETRTFEIGSPGAAGRSRRRRGVRFETPRRSLVETVESGYFDDLLIGNFTRTQLIGISSLYPNFTPIVAKLGGAARVFTPAQRRRFEWRYLRLSPRAYVSDWMQGVWLFRLKPRLRSFLRRIGLLQTVKRLGRRVRGLPALPVAAPPDLRR